MQTSLRDHVLPLAAIGLSAIALSVGWGLFAWRLDHRESRAVGSMDEAARIWGGRLNQPQPEVRWRRADAATVELARGELASTEVDVSLDTQYRRRGVVEVPGYEARFNGKWIFRNPTPEPIFAAFTIGLPVERSALMLGDLRLLVDGEEDAAHTEYAADRIVWTGQIKGDRTAEMAVQYRARGIERFGYSLAAARLSSEATPVDGSARPVTNFLLTMHVKGARGALDYPVGTMAPNDVSAEGGGSVLVWKIDRVLTAFDIGVVLPDTGGVTRALGRLIGNAPWFYLLYAVGLLYAFAEVRRRARTLHVLGLSAAYFLYFPLATYLTAYLSWPIACALALAGISALAVLHAARFVGRTAAARVAGAQVLFLAVPAAAYLVPAHTGIILVVAGFAALGATMHALGVAARSLDGGMVPAESAS